MNPSCSLIISTYNWPEALELVLLSVLKQNIMPNEIIIADDGSEIKTQNLIRDFQKKIPIALKHVWHEDLGFRKTLILNNAFREVRSEYIIQIDGDIILHPNFIADHLEFAENNCWVNGSRVLLDPTSTKRILKSKDVALSLFTKGITNHFNAVHSRLLRNLLFSSKHLDIKKVRGCNMAFWFSDFKKINGYNEDILGWGREDSEFAARLVNNNINKKNLKFGGIEFHLYHKEESRNKLSVNDKIQEHTILNGVKVCENGYSKV